MIKNYSKDKIKMISLKKNYVSAHKFTLFPQKIKITPSKNTESIMIKLGRLV